MYKSSNVPSNLADKSSSTEAMKSTRGMAKDGAMSSGYGLGEVKMPFGGNVSQDCGKKLPKAEKGIC